METQRGVQAGVAVLLLGFGFQSQAKCALAEYRVMGSVVDEATKKPVAGATVIVFLGDQNQVLSDGWSAKKTPDFSITLSNGAFSSTSYFDTYSGFSFIGDQCDKRPQSVEVILMAPNYRTQRSVLRIRSAEKDQGDEVVRMSLPPIEIEKSRR